MNASVTRVSATRSQTCRWPFMELLSSQKQMCKCPREEHSLRMLSSRLFKGMLACSFHTFEGGKKTSKVKVTRLRMKWATPVERVLPRTWESDQLASRTRLLQHECNINRAACFSSLEREEEMYRGLFSFASWKHELMVKINSSQKKKQIILSFVCALFSGLYLFMHISKHILCLVTGQNTLRPHSLS